MGGSGSDRRWNVRPTTDQAMRLDVRKLARDAVIDPLRSGSRTWAWTVLSGPAGGVLVRYDANRPFEVLVISRQYPGGRARATLRCERICLDWTPCHFGGERVWCRCPRCGSRRAVLFGRGGRFRCVSCQGLAYRVTREDPLDRTARRGAKLLRRLGAEPSWVLTWSAPPEKPPGMHWRTYERLEREWDAIWCDAWRAYLASVGERSEQGTRLLTLLEESRALTLA